MKGEYFDIVVGAAVNFELVGKAFFLVVILIKADEFGVGLGDVGLHHSGGAALAAGGDDDIIEAFVVKFSKIKAAVAITLEEGAHAFFVCPDGEVCGVGKGVEEGGCFIAARAHVFDVDGVLFGEETGSVAEVKG